MNHNRKPEKSEIEEPLAPCPYCDNLLPQSKLDCAQCKNWIPYCIVTVRIPLFHAMVFILYYCNS